MGQLTLPAGMEALQSAFQSNPEQFQAFVAGIVTATLQNSEPTGKAIAPAASSLKQVFDVYERVATCIPRTVRNNIGSLRIIVSRVLGADPEHVPLSSIDQTLIFRYQERCVDDCKASADPDNQSQREAVARALRSSRSTITQARSVFTGRGIDMLARYEAEGLSIPPSVREFLTCKLRGERQKKAYRTPKDPEAVFNQIFADIELKRLIDPALYVGFWLIAGAGLRQRELRDANWANVIEEGGKLVFRGGIGKNGRPIDVPIQERAAKVLREFLKEEGRIVDHRAGRRLNFFLRAHGLSMTQKAAHEIRAYVGARIFEHDHRAAQGWLRHSSIQVTESAYANRYVRAAIVPEVL